MSLLLWHSDVVLLNMPKRLSTYIKRVKTIEIRLQDWRDIIPSWRDMNAPNSKLPRDTLTCDRLKLQSELQISSHLLYLLSFSQTPSRWLLWQSPCYPVKEKMCHSVFYFSFPRLSEWQRSLSDVYSNCLILLSASAVLSIVGNLLVLIVAFRRSSRMKPPELLSVNLAVTDLGAAVTMYPLAVASAWSHHWIGGDVSCIYYGLAGFFFGIASIMNLTILAIVRFVVSLNLHSPSKWFAASKDWFNKIFCLY